MSSEHGSNSFQKQIHYTLSLICTVHLLNDRVKNGLTHKTVIHPPEGKGTCTLKMWFRTRAKFSCLLTGVHLVDFPHFFFDWTTLRVRIHVHVHVHVRTYVRPFTCFTCFAVSCQHAI